MSNPVERLEEAWEAFVLVYNEESPKIVKKVKKEEGSGMWVLRIDDSSKTLLVQDIHPFIYRPDISMGQASELFQSADSKK